MKKKITFSLLCCLLLTVIFQSCENDTDSDTLSNTEFHKKAQLTNIYDNEISPLSLNFTEQTLLLRVAIQEYQVSPTAENLSLAQEQWKASQLVWKQLELYDLASVADSFISFEINRWPTDTSRIEENINGTELLNEEFIASKGSSSKGLAALEYLLFARSDASLSTASDYEIRKSAYMISVAQNLNTKAIELEALWKTNEADFVGALENGISGSQNQVINAMVTLIEEIIISKLGNPLGDTNGGTIEPERFEAYYSKFSKEIIQQHLTALNRSYKGDFAQTSFRVGFDDFLELIGSEEFSIKISDQFSECQKQLDAIKGTLEDEIVSNPDNVVALKDSLRDLLVLIKVDMANVLGSTITFNDNDGD